MADDEVRQRTLDFIERQAKAKRPCFCSMCPARAHIDTYVSEKYEAMLGQDGRGLQEVVMKVPRFKR